MAAVDYSIDALITAMEKKSQARKPLKLVVLRGKYDVSVPSLETGFFNATDRSKISIDPAEWEPFGILSKDGLSRDTKVKMEESDGYNYIDPIREDLVSADRSLTFTLRQDFTRVSLEHQFGMNLAGLKPNQTKGIAFDEPNIPLTPFYRILCISADYFMQDVTKPIYEVTLYTSVKQIELPKLVRKPNETQDTDLTFGVRSDENIGTPVRHWIDGVGYDATTHGFAAA